MLHIPKIEKRFKLTTSFLAIPPTPEMEIINTTNSLIKNLKLTTNDYHLFRDTLLQFNLTLKYNTTLEPQYKSTEPCKECLFELPVHANTQYNITVICKIYNSPNLREFWSEKKTFHLITPAEIPLETPKVAVGGYYKKSDDIVQLYWSPVELAKQNGNNFRYIIQQLNERGDVM